MRLSKKETAFYIFVIVSGFALLGVVIYVAVTTNKKGESEDSLSEDSPPNKFLSE